MYDLCSYFNSDLKSDAATEQAEPLESVDHMNSSNQTYDTKAQPPNGDYESQKSSKETSDSIQHQYISLDMVDSQQTEPRPAYLKSVLSPMVSDQRLSTSNKSENSNNELNHISLKRPKTSNTIKRTNDANKPMNTINIYKAYERQTLIPKPPVPNSKQAQKPKIKRKTVNTNHIHRERSGSLTCTKSSLSPHGSRGPSPARSDVGGSRDLSPYRISSASRQIHAGNKWRDNPRASRKSTGRRPNTKLPPIGPKQGLTLTDFEE